MFSDNNHMQHKFDSKYSNKVVIIVSFKVYPYVF